MALPDLTPEQRAEALEKATRARRRRGSARRITCVLIVEAPDTRRPPVTFCATARANARTSTPGCSQKRRSSAATSARAIQCSGAGW